MLRDMATDGEHTDEKTDLNPQVNTDGLPNTWSEILRDHAPIPRAVLREVRTILEDPTHVPTPLEKLRYVRDLLRPFLANL